MESTGAPLPFGDSSYETALCLLPPAHMWKSIDRLRFLNDKAYGKWPPHVNIIYPFVRAELLEEAASTLSRLDWDHEPLPKLSLQEADTFSHKKSNTIFLRPSKGQETESLARAFDRLRTALGRPVDPEYQPHLTLAQSEGASSALHQSLLAKARLISPLAWSPTQMTILIREVDTGENRAVGRMKIWGTIGLDGGIVNSWRGTADPYGEAPLHIRASHPILNASGVREACFRYLPTSQSWEQQVKNHVTPKNTVDTIVLASYNLADDEYKPMPTAERFPCLVRNIRSQRAAADILILQEVNDDLLAYLLADEEICATYPFATHGQPAHPQTGPLPSLRNLVVLSRFPMKLQYLVHRRKGRYSIIVEFPSVQLHQIGKEETKCLFVATCHLDADLRDEVVAANHEELHELLMHLRNSCAGHPCVIAGGLNLATSSPTIDRALADGTLSREAEQQLRDIEAVLSMEGFQDAWLRTRIEAGESSSAIQLPHSFIQLYEGEQGATFDPGINAQTFRSAENDMYRRPQRYNRIFVGQEGGLQPKGFNIFDHESFDGKTLQDSTHSSAHKGIRCLLQSPNSLRSSMDLGAGGFQMRRVSTSWGSSEELRRRLSAAGVLPDQADEVARMEAVLKLREILVDSISAPSNAGQKFKPSFVLLTVGSVGLGVWTTSSNINCLALGGIASNTFFALATRRLKKASGEGITLLRRGRTRAGTMLMLLVQGFRVELQYCPSVLMAERCPEILSRPPSDPVFNMPNQTLLKLKPARDLAYLRRSIPDLAQYRLAHLLIKAWATTRGLYAADFGYLNAMHISALLVPVCKLIASTGEVHTVADLVATFFHRYASFDWENQIVLDPFFHKGTKYHRSFREPLCLLGWHAPALNTASSATTSVVKVLGQEMARADALLSRPGSTWDDIISNDSGNYDFRQAYPLYIKIEIRYWAPFDAGRARFLGWLKSRCCCILDDLNRKSPMVASRIWPRRFIHDETQGTPTEPQEYHGCYLIGLQPIAEDTKKSTSKAAKEAAQGDLTKVLSDCETSIRGDDAYYDPRLCWVSLTLVGSSELGSLQPDHNDLDVSSDAYDQWAVSSEDDLLSDDEEIMSDDGFEQDQTQKDTLPATAPPRSKTVSRMDHDFGDASNAAGGPVLGKFRTATDVINRLKWDDLMDSSDFVVGYEDRFAGPQEKALALWKGDPTHEEFIPQHRILYFKRRSDGGKVWERSTRLDKVFGSGARH